MSDDILTRIDDTLTDASACFCGCPRRITAASASPWFASDECQIRWNSRRIGYTGGIEERPEPVEVRRRPHGCVCPNDMPANEYQPGCPSCEEWVARLNAAVTTPEEAAAVPSVFHAASPTSPWVSFADVAAGPSAGVDSAVDVRRRVQDGTAPAPDPVGDAMRAEVLRQGLTECEIDGVRWIYGGGQWSVSPFQVEALRPERPIRSRFPKPVGRDTIDLAACNNRMDFLGEVFYCGKDEGHCGPHRRGTKTWVDMTDEPEPPAAPRLPWWKRWTPWA